MNRLTVPSPNGTSVITWFMRMLVVTLVAWSAYFSRMALAAAIQSSDKNWWDMSRCAPCMKW